jgi:hypothetical protein
MTAKESNDREKPAARVRVFHATLRHHLLILPVSAVNLADDRSALPIAAPLRSRFPP